MKNNVAWIIGIIVIIGAVVGVVAVRNHKKTTPTTTTIPATAIQQPASTPKSGTTPSSQNTISITNFSFSPANTTVKKGTTVTWTNKDSVAHTVTVDSGSGPNSKSLNNGDSYSFTFDQTGTFAYHCSVHSDMHATVTVTD